MSVALASERCTACGLCLLACPTRALLAAPRHPVILPGRCTGCGDCVEVCPRDALALTGPDAKALTGTDPRRPS